MWVYIINPYFTPLRAGTFQELVLFLSQFLKPVIQILHNTLDCSKLPTAAGKLV